MRPTQSRNVECFAALARVEVPIRGISLLIPLCLQSHDALLSGCVLANDNQLAVAVAAIVPGILEPRRKYLHSRAPFCLKASAKESLLCLTLKPQSRSIQKRRPITRESKFKAARSRNCDQRTQSLSLNLA